MNGSNEPLRRCGHSKLSKMAACRQLAFDVTGNSAIRSADPENPTVEPNMKCIGSPVAQIRNGCSAIMENSKFSKMAAGRHGFDVTRNSGIRSANPENPTIEPNMKCIGSSIAEIWPFAYLGDIRNPHFGGRGGHRGSAMAPFERATVVSYRL